MLGSMQRHASTLRLFGHACRSMRFEKASSAASSSRLSSSTAIGGDAYQNTILHASAPQTDVPRVEIRHKVQEAYIDVENGGQALDEDLFENDDLYESADRLYELHATEEKAIKRIKNPRTLIRDALRKGTYEEARALLHELEHYHPKVEMMPESARTALHFAREEDFDTCMFWVQHISPAFTYKMPENKRWAERQVSEILLLLQSGAKADLTWKAVLYISRKGYLLDWPDFREDIANTFAWLVAHAYRYTSPDLGSQTFGEWGVRYFVQLYHLAQLGYQDHTIALAEDPQRDNERLAKLEKRMNYLYSKAIIELCNTKQRDAAWMWLQFDKSIGVTSSQEMYQFRASPKALYVFLRHLLDHPDTRHLELNMKQTRGSLAKTMMRRLWVLEDLDDGDFKRYHLLADLVVQGAKKGPWSSQYDRLTQMVQEALHQPGKTMDVLPALTQAFEDTGFVPPQPLLTYIDRMPTKSSAEQMAMEAYRTSLGNNRINGVKLLFARSKIVRLLEAHQANQALREYLSYFSDRHLFALAQIALQGHPFANLLHGLNPVGGAIFARHYITPATSALGLRCLVDVLRRDVRRLAILYDAWHSSLASFDRRKVGDDEERQSEVEFPHLDLWSYGTNHAQWSAVDETRGQSTEKPSAELLHGLASTFAVPPTVRHYQHFLAVIPRKMIDSARRMSNRSIEQRNRRLEARQKAMEMFTDARRFSIEPDIIMMSHLMCAVARSLDSADGPVSTMTEEGYEVRGFARHEDNPGFDALLSITRGLGMGPDSVDENVGGNGLELRATPRQYALLMRALVSVPHAWGGPFVDEAKEVYVWLKNDKVAQEALQKDKFGEKEWVESALAKVMRVEVDQDVFQKGRSSRGAVAKDADTSADKDSRRPEARLAVVDEMKVEKQRQAQERGLPITAAAAGEEVDFHEPRLTVE